MELQIVANIHSHGVLIQPVKSTETSTIQYGIQSGQRIQVVCMKVRSACGLILMHGVVFSSPSKGENVIWLEGDTTARSLMKSLIPWVISSRQ